MRTSPPQAPGATGPDAEDPVLALYRRYREVEDAGDAVYARHKILRAALIEKFGDPNQAAVSAAASYVPPSTAGRHSGAATRPATRC